MNVSQCQLPDSIVNLTSLLKYVTGIHRIPPLGPFRLCPPALRDDHHGRPLGVERFDIFSSIGMPIDGVISD